MFSAFEIVVLDFESFKNDQKFLITDFVPISNKNYFP